MLNSKMYNFQMYLNGSREVSSLHDGAKTYGGATCFEDKIISNYYEDDFINILNENTVDIFVPSTMNVNNIIDNSLFVKQVITMIKSKYNLNTMKFYKTKGSWYDNDADEVITEDIVIVSIKLNTLKDSDIKYFISIAEWIKEAMKQQAVSVNFNNALAII